MNREGPGWARPAAPLVALLAFLGTAEGVAPVGNPLMILLPPEALASSQGANGFVVAGNFFSGGVFHWMPTSGVTAIGGLSVAAVSRDGKTIAGKERSQSNLEEAGDLDGGKRWRLLGSVRPNAQPCDALLSSAFGTNDDGRVVVGLAWDGCFVRPGVPLGRGDGDGRPRQPQRGPPRGPMASPGDGRVVIGWEAPTGFRGRRQVGGRKGRADQGTHGDGGRGLYGPNRDGSLIAGAHCDPTDTVGPPTAWTWTQAAGVKCFPVVRAPWVPRLPYQAYMFGTSDDGRVIGGSLSFGFDAEALVWFDGEVFFLPRLPSGQRGSPDAFEGWVNTGFVTRRVADGRTLVGYGAGPTTFQGYVVVLPELDEK